MKNSLVAIAAASVAEDIIAEITSSYADDGMYMYRGLTTAYYTGRYMIIGADSNGSPSMNESSELLWVQLELRIEGVAAWACQPDDDNSGIISMSHNPISDPEGAMGVC